MATVITELETFSSRRESIKVFNITLTNATVAVDLLAANVNYRYGIKNLTLAGQYAGTEWWEFLDGEDVLIGPLITNTGIPWVLNIDEIIYCDNGNALKFKSKSAVPTHMILEVVYGEPYPSSSPSASASESE